MDTITSLALSIDSPILKAVGAVLDNALAYGLMILALIFIGEKRDGKRSKIIISIILAVFLASAIKFAIARDRPCAGMEWCPESYSFPSMHAAVAFALMTGFLNKKSYPAYALFALFVCFTRINLGVHIFVDIAGALPVALISYYLTDMLYKEGEDGS